MLIPVSARTLRRSPIRSSLALTLLVALLLIPQTSALRPRAQPLPISALPAAPAASAPAPSDAMTALPAQMRATVFAQLGQDDPAARLPLAVIPTRQPPAAPATTIAKLPLPLQLAITAQLGRDDVTAQLEALPGGRYRTMAASGLAATLDATTLRLGGPAADWTLQLQGWGRAGALHLPDPQAPASLDGNRVSFQHAGL